MRAKSSSKSVTLELTRDEAKALWEYMAFGEPSNRRLYEEFEEQLVDALEVYVREG